MNKGKSEDDKKAEWKREYIICFNCDKKGHYAFECRKSKKSDNPNSVPVGSVGNI